MSLAFFPPAVLLALGSLSFTTSDLGFRLGETETVALDTGGELRGSGIRLEWLENRCRGEVFSVPVSLDWGGGLVSGTIGDEPVTLQVSESNMMVVYEGTIGGRRASGVLGSQLVTASLGHCFAALGTAWSGYEGLMNCGGVIPRQEFAISYPRSLSSAQPEAEAALTALLVWAAEGLHPEGFREAPSPAPAQVSQDLTPDGGSLAR